MRSHSNYFCEEQKNIGVIIMRSHSDFFFLQRMNEHNLRIVMKYCGLPPLVLIFMTQIAHRIQNRLCYAEFLPCYGVMEVEGVGEVGDVRGGGELLRMPYMLMVLQVFSGVSSIYM